MFLKLSTISDLYPFNLDRAKHDTGLLVISLVFSATLFLERPDVLA